MEFKRMSDVTSHYIVRAKRETEAQYESFRTALTKGMQHQGLFRLNKNLEYFKVPSASVERN